MAILDQYTASGPDLQNTIDLFQGEWSSQFPDRLGLRAGAAGLFEDARIQWAAEQIGSFQDKTVLELGPLEAGHTFMMEQLGAASITSVEANSRSFLKCLLVKEILDMQRSHFIYSDCIEFLKENSARFDVCVASGILYHMVNPVELIALAAQCSDRLFVWTHYYDAEMITREPRFAVKFPGSTANEYGGFQHTLHRYEYQAALDWSGFCGGSAPHSNWLSRDEILACCRHFGFEDIRIGFDHPEHVNGPCFAFAALKRNSDAVTETRSQPARSGIDAEVDRLKKRVTNLQKKTQNLEQELKDAHSRIGAMETSKFWQLRERWFRIKKTLGLPSNE